MRPVLTCEFGRCPDLFRLAARFSAWPGTVLIRDPGVPGTAPARMILGVRPFLAFVACGCECTVSINPFEAVPGPEIRFINNPWEVLDRVLAPYVADQSLAGTTPGWPAGACIGYWGFELNSFVEPRLGAYRPSDLGLPDCCLFFYDSLLVWDWPDGVLRVVSTGWGPGGVRSEARARAALGWWERELATPISDGDGSHTHVIRRRKLTDGIEFRSSMSRAEFLAAVRRALEYIRLGHVYQVNLSHRLEVPLAVDAWALFGALEESTHAPYLGYCNFGAFQLVSASPELFLRMDGARVMTRPIKGTRPRMDDPRLDALMLEELRSSAKERAELVMITDLMRNDLGRVCQFGSVKVPCLSEIETHPYVYHQVSTVVGELKPGVRHLDAVRACFPGGSVTGAPKFRAMQIIAELEPVPRGPYTGALGFIGFSGSSQLAMVIRTAICLADRVCFNVGAGIVWESDPEAEYQETLSKASGFARAVEAVADKAAAVDPVAT